MPRFSLELIRDLSRNEIVEALAIAQVKIITMMDWEFFADRDIEITGDHKKYGMIYIRS